MTVLTTRIETPLGPMVAGTTDAGVCLLEFADRRALPSELEELARRRGRVVQGEHPHLVALRDQLTAYFDGAPAAFAFPLDTPGSPFQRAVWAELRRIPFGMTTTYEEIARRVRRPGASRAVGRANSANRIAIVIPCHRVVAADGSLTGYGGGLDRKRRLLELEGSRASRPGEALDARAEQCAVEGARPGSTPAIGSRPSR